MNAKIRPNALHMYGTDSMTTEDVLSYFGAYRPSQVEWLNDSSCNIVFEDAANCTQALTGIGTPIDEAIDLPKHWLKGPDFRQNKILLRPAYDEDKKDPFHTGKRSHFYATALQNNQGIGNKKRKLPSRGKQTNRKVRKRRKIDVVMQDVTDNVSNNEQKTLDETTQIPKKEKVIILDETTTEEPLNLE